ncbi:hypothetical protein [Sporomusa termitida]|uniref:Uncharacterized protein n=1 Tax=Sporomusa termitida TaxID=2377 RepID=A0A517DTJ3_9FIRM|nr:hypothetical protein [Sporomusa termitida]QDR80606.1 hypothetical protein SPTER_19350 [Sporomusa termitida]
MTNYENASENPVVEKGKLLTYGGKVDGHLMNMLKEAQKAAGIKKFSDFMHDMLQIYSDNKQVVEPPQMQVMKKAVYDIMTTTESLLQAMQIIEEDKFKAIAEYRHRAQAAEEHTLQLDSKIAELEKSLAEAKRESIKAQSETATLHADLMREAECRQGMEGIINSVQRMAAEAAALKKKAEEERTQALELAAEAGNKTALLEAANADILARLTATETTAKRCQEELVSEKSSTQLLREKLTNETIARNRLEERLQVIEPLQQLANQKIDSLQAEIASLRWSEQSLSRHASSLEAQLKACSTKLQELQKN